MEKCKDVNGYSNIRIFVFVPNIRIRFLNSNIRIFFLSLRFFVIFLLFRFFLQSFQTQNCRLVLKGGKLKSVISLINCTLVTVDDVLTTIKTIVNSLQIV